MIDLHETIVAPATAPGESAIAIVRLSGSLSARIASRFVFMKSGRSVVDIPARRLLSCEIRREAEIIDHAMCVRLAAPRSYTGEEMIELHLHGNPVIVNLVLDLAVEAGARLASPGEFSRRAFLNGKLDLTQVEGLAAVIKSESERALFYSQRQLHGELASAFGRLRVELVRLLGLLELELDFCEEGYVLSARDEILALVDALRGQVDLLLASFRTGERLLRGPRILLMGLPNAGKSSLFNALVGFSRALVSAVPGTTRDYVEERVAFGGLVFHFIDTAGVRATEDALEAAGIELSQHLLEVVDLVVFLIDSSGDLDDSHRVLADLRDRYPSVRFRVVFTKADLVSVGIARDSVSVLDRSSIERLLEVLAGDFSMENSESLMLLSRRQFDLLSGLRKQLEAANWESADAELLSYELRGILAPLDELSGAVTSSEVLDEIFAAFCIGK